MHTQEWGAGEPVIALHPLALESTAFAGLGEDLAEQGLRTIAPDLPGFGQTPAPDLPLTPAVLAAPVIALARSLERPPLILGMSMGGRVALEAALTAPDAFQGAVLVAPYLPWRRRRWALGAARHLDPAWGERLPLEKIWPLLKRMAHYIDGLPMYEHDWINRAAVRVVYYGSCPATRVAFLSASRELALDPAFGRRGLWPRLASLAIPATFMWGGRDRLIPGDHVEKVAAVLPSSGHVEVACSAHFVSGPHFRCMRRSTVLAVKRTQEAARGQVAPGLRIRAPCVAAERADEPDVSHPSPAGATGESQ